MKTKFLFLIMIVVSSLSFGQKQNQVKVYSRFANAGYSSVKEKETLRGGCSVFTPTNFYVNELGFLYNRKISKIFRLETGVNYISSEVNVTHYCHYDPLIGDYETDREEDWEIDKEGDCGTDDIEEDYETDTKEIDKLQLVTIPITLIAEFGEYFYLNGGFLLDFQTNKPKYLTSQSGIGAVLGVGGKYDYKDFTFFINPELKFHRLIGFKKQEAPEFLGSFGAKIGVAYNF